VEEIKSALAEENVAKEQNKDAEMPKRTTEQNENTIINTDDSPDAEKPKASRKPRKKKAAEGESDASVENGEEKQKAPRKPRKKKAAEGESDASAENGEEKQKAPRKPRKKKAADGESDASAENGEEKQKPPRKPRKKKAAEGESDASVENGEEKPKAPRKPRKKKAAEGESDANAENGEEKQKAPRKPRKKKAAEGESAEDKTREKKKEYFSPPTLEISLIDYSDSDDNISEKKADADSYDPNRILPPDEIFSTHIPSFMSVQVQLPSEEDKIEEDGQYTISYPDVIPDQEPEEEEDELPEKEELPKKYNPDKPRKIDGHFDFVELFVFTLLAVMLITSFFFRHSIVDGSSMKATLENGEHLIISDLFYTPSRGDIIVCEDYSTGIRKPIVKRVIAVGGDTVKITVKGEIYINGKILVEDYVYIDSNMYRYQPLEVVVPEGELFVMGDHRNLSSDSREFGTVSEESVLGRVLLRFYPFDKFGVPK